MGDKGQVDARDISDAKLNLVMDGADRLGLACISCQAGDARDISGGDYDVVIADVPCSGLGVIRKKPDIRYREKAELDRLPELQLELLESIAQAVKPGGRLLYSTCTWRQRENGAVVEAFLQSHPQFEKTLERTFWPDLDGTDGFYICRMERKNRI
jgi:16S rRNA (cytosine967-C5)-methyltransferase